MEELKMESEAKRAIFWKIAKRNLTKQKVRSILSIVGIVIGVAAVATLGIMGNSIKLAVMEVFSETGNEVIVTPLIEPLTDKDIKRISTINHVEEAVPIALYYYVSVTKEIPRQIILYGIHSSDMPTLLELEKGRYPREASTNCVVGAKLAEDENLKGGSMVRIGNQNLRVVGILKERGIGLDIQADNAAFQTISACERLYGFSGYLEVVVKVDNGENVPLVMDEIENKFNSRRDKVLVNDVKKLMESVEQVYDILSIFLMGIGAVSLVVGGVGIMNVILVSTIERTKEIGIMRAIGTRRVEVLKMFLFEALILGLIGGTAGGLLGLGGGAIVDVFLLKKASYLFDPGSLFYAGIAIIFGIATSLISGFYPSWKVSRMPPIEALRYE
jgi:putative ABC transport system permease protein